MRCLSRTGHTHFFPDTRIQQAAEQAPSVHPSSWSSDDKYLTNALRHDIIPVLHEPIQHPGWMWKGLIPAETIAILYENSISNGRTPLQAVLFDSCKRAHYMNNVQFLQLLKRHTIAKFWPLAPTQPLVSNWPSVFAVPKEPAAKPPRRQTLFVSFKVPARQSVLQVVLVPPFHSLSKVRLCGIDVELPGTHEANQCSQVSAV
mmetsp:Transcript_127778/g.238862  ORF Transcript_127778/g.238862 Transcript_127778/m.238862 type:complete len:203 (+) Transcript_127778:343-951(+)